MERVEEAPGRPVRWWKAKGRRRGGWSCVGGSEGFDEDGGEGGSEEEEDEEKEEDEEEEEVRRGTEVLVSVVSSFRRFRWNFLRNFP